MPSWPDGWAYFAPLVASLKVTGGAAMAGRPEAGEIHAAGDAGGRRGTLDLVPVGPVRRHVLRRLHPAGPVKGLERHICGGPP